MLSETDGEYVKRSMRGRQGETVILGRGGEGWRGRGERR